MKNRLFAIGLIIILPVTGAILSGCNSQAGESFVLEAPGCTATWNDDITWVAWSKVEGADYYEVWGKEYNKKEGQSPPYNLKEFSFIVKKIPSNPNDRVTKDDYSYAHTTRDDYSYAVKAFKNNGDHSDFSNVAFTW
jgi:hypothetical protein